VFVHGYNVNPTQARAWADAMFKRLWWSGIDAGFTAVLWRGNESQLWISHKKCYATLNYHQNVLNAFRTASTFSSRVNSLPGAKKYMIAHSLGNMLVSAERQDYGLHYEQYFMLNAAVPIEAYDSVNGVTTNSHHDMTPKVWRPYEDRVRSTHWYELFLSDTNDERGKLTWKGRFKDVDNTINFYSSMDEVVANGSDRVDELLSRDFAWYNQEQAKGALLVSLSPQAGWNFSDYYLKREPVPNINGAYTNRLFTAEEMRLVADTNLMVRPFFRDFRDRAIYGEGGSDFVQTNDFVHWYALSHGIPAESFAVGANPVPKWGKDCNADMAIVCNPKAQSANEEAQDPQGGNSGSKKCNWKHSYFIGNSLFDTKKLYEKLAGEINTNTEGNNE